MAIPFFSIFLFAATMVGILFVLLALRMRHATGANADLTTCGKCGYAVAGLERMTCPECGSDFREVGMLTPVQRVWWTPVVLLILWMFISPIALCIVSGILMQIVPEVQTTTTQSSYRSPSSGAYVQVDLNASSRTCTGWFGGSPAVGSGQVVWTATFQRERGPHPTLTVDRPGQQVQFDFGGSSRNLQGELDIDAFIRWWRETVGEVDAEMIRAELTYIGTARNQSGGQTGGGWGTAIADLPFDGGVVGSSSSGNSSPHPAAAAVVIGGAILIWILGIVLIMRLKR